MQNENKQTSLKKGKTKNIYNIFRAVSRSTRKFLILFIWKMVYLSSEKNMKKLNEENLYENFLIEIKKPKLYEILAKGKKIFINMPDGKDIHTIASFLKMIPYIKRFLEFNLIEEYNYQFFCNNLVFKSLHTNDDVFESKSSYKNFTIVCKGKVLVTSVKNAVEYNNLELNETNQDGVNEYAKYAKERNNVKFEIETHEYSEKIYQKGEFFSRKIRSYDGSTIFFAKALEPTHIIYIDYKMYEILFEKSIQKSEKDRKNFVLRTIKTMRELGPSRFDVFFRLLEVNFLEHNQFLYCEGEKADKLHIIYHGSFEYKVKDFSKLRYIDKIQLGKENLFTLLKLEKGDIVGLESLKENSIYQQTMKAVSNYAIVLSFNPFNIGGDAFEKLIKFLDEFIQGKKQILKNLITSNTILQEKFKIKYRLDLTQAFMRISTYEKFIKNQIDNKAQEIIKQSLNSKNVRLKNEDFRNIYVKMKMTDSMQNNIKNTNYNSNSHFSNNTKDDLSIILNNFKDIKGRNTFSDNSLSNKFVFNSTLNTNQPNINDDQNKENELRIKNEIFAKDNIENRFDSNNNILGEYKNYYKNIFEDSNDENEKIKINKKFKKKEEIIQEKMKRGLINDIKSTKKLRISNIKLKFVGSNSENGQNPNEDLQNNQILKSRTEEKIVSSNKDLDSNNIFKESRSIKICSTDKEKKSINIRIDTKFDTEIKSKEMKKKNIQIKKMNNQINKISTKKNEDQNEKKLKKSVESDVINPHENLMDHKLTLKESKLLENFENENINSKKKKLFQENKTIKNIKFLKVINVNEQINPKHTRSLTCFYEKFEDKIENGKKNIENNGIHKSKLSNNNGNLFDDKINFSNNMKNNNPNSLNNHKGTKINLFNQPIKSPNKREVEINSCDKKNDENNEKYLIRKIKCNFLLKSNRKRNASLFNDLNNSSKDYNSQGSTIVGVIQNNNPFEYEKNKNRTTEKKKVTSKNNYNLKDNKYINKNVIVSKSIDFNNEIHKNSNMRSIFSSHDFKNINIIDDLNNLRNFVVQEKYNKLFDSLENFEKIKENLIQIRHENWVNSKKINSLHFNTGSFSLPLFSKIKKK